MVSFKFALPLVLALSFCGPVLAEQNARLPLVDAEGGIVLSAAGHEVTLPFPDWLRDRAPSAANIDDLAFVRFVDGTTTARLEIYPRGEGEAFWSTLFGVRIIEQSNPVLAEMRSVVVDLYARSCRPDMVALFQLEADGTDTIPPLGYVCGRYRDATGNGGFGEVMIMGFYKTSIGSALVYQEWRAEAFDPADPATWPVSADEIEARIAELQTQVGFTELD